MKKVILFSLLALFAGHILAQNIQSIAVGTKAPLTEVKLKDVSGKEVSIADATNKNGVLIMFSCNTCPYVIKNQKRTLDIAAFAAKNNIGVIIINSNDAKRDADDSFEAMQAYAKEQKYACFYVLDEGAKVADAFGATRTPELFLLNKEGVVVYKGAIDDNPSEPEHVQKQFAKDAISAVSKGQDIKVKESKSVGCTIKRKS